MVTRKTVVVDGVVEGQYVDDVVDAVAAAVADAVNGVAVKGASEVFFLTKTIPL